jgi:hypothetical protein
MPRAFDSKLTLSLYKSNIGYSTDFTPDVKTEICTQQNHNHLIRSIDQIKSFSNKQNYDSLSFNTAIYLSNSLIERFCVKLNSKIQEIGTFNSRIEIKIDQEANVKDSKENAVLFKIADKNELDYAQKLCDFEGKIFRPALENRTKRASNSKFSRYFFVDTNTTGKSIHITQNLINILNYKGYKEIEFNRSSFNLNEAETFLVNNRYSNLAQFHDYLKANEEIRVSNLYFDFYYWSCLSNNDQFSIK